MGAASGAISAAILFAAMGLSIWLIIRQSEREGQRAAITGIEQVCCPHQLHGRLKVYSRPLRRFGRKDIYKICAGCGKRMN